MNLEIEITNQQSQVIGTVSNGRGEPVKDYSVVVFSRDRERWTFPQTRYVRPGQPDQDGRFKIMGLPAGDYYAVAVDSIEPGETSDPEFLDRVKDRATSFSLGDGGTMTYDDLLTFMRNGNTYVNVHTTRNQPGEIRGQISAQ